MSRGIGRMDKSLDELINNNRNGRRRNRLRNRASRRASARNKVKELNFPTEQYLLTNNEPSKISNELAERLGPPKVNSLRKKKAPKPRVVPSLQPSKKLNIIESFDEEGVVLEISNINFKATPHDVEAILSSFGEIVDFVVFTGNDGQFKGSVRVKFKNRSDGLNVIKKLNGQVADGRILSVFEVKGISISGLASMTNREPHSDAHTSNTRRNNVKKNNQAQNLFFKKSLAANGVSAGKNNYNESNLHDNSKGVKYYDDAYPRFVYNMRIVL